MSSTTNAPKRFDKHTLSCVIIGHLNVGEDPEDIFYQLENAPTVDTTDLKEVLINICKNRGLHFNSETSNKQGPYKTMQEEEDISC